MRHALASVGLGVSLLACGQGDVATAPSGDGLRVGTEPVGLEIVGSVAAARGLAPREALRLVVDDMRFAEHLREASPEVASYLRRVALARALSQRTFEAAKAAGPPSDAELEEFTARHWWQLDRPQLSRTVHLLVRVQKDDDKSRARAVAEKLRPLLAAAPTREGFERVARDHAADGFELKVEALDPVAADGRVVDPTRPPRPGDRRVTFTPAFAQAADSLSAVGEVSDPIETPFGFHVLLLTERFPEARLGPEERRRALRAEVETERARVLERGTIERVRAETGVEVQLGAFAWTEGFASGP